MKRAAVYFQEFFSKEKEQVRIASDKIMMKTWTNAHLPLQPVPVSLYKTVSQK